MCVVSGRKGKGRGEERSGTEQKQRVWLFGRFGLVCDNTRVHVDRYAYLL